ncbi:MAG: hypothetical protein MUC99_02315 [Anaerolineae bacterium]|jgi:hypothetical protein|nr:hypothetical protein [Anaerolineae bacterium]
MPDSPFTDEWRACLREHYKATARANERETLKTLGGVMNRVGFREDELRELYVLATMRADDLPADFVPDLEQVGAPTPPPEAAAPLENRHPLECQCPSCVEKNLVPHDRDGQALTGDALAEALDRAAHDQAAGEAEDSDGLQQLSLF